MKGEGDQGAPPGSETRSRRQLAVRVTFALSIGLIAGVLFSWATFPLPWMLGPMVALTVAAVLRLPISSPSAARPYVVVVIGVMLGSGFTPALYDQLGAWALSFAFLIVYIAVCGALVVPYYQRIAGFDRVTANFSGMPGGLNEMMLVGRDMGGDERKIALAHASRIVVVVAFVAIWFRLIQGLDLSDRSQFGTPFVEIPGIEIAVLFLAGVIGFFLGRALRLPAPTLLGPMIVSAAVHIAGWTDSPPPQELVVVAQIVLGTIIGCRFVGSSPGLIGQAILISIGATLVMLTITLLFAFGVHGLFRQSFEQVVLAYSPGGLAEMSLVALAMNADIAYVASHHLVRITFIVMVAPVVFRYFQRAKGSD